MGNEEFDEFAELEEDDVWYSDDPAEEKKTSFQSKAKGFIPVIVLIVAAVIYLPTTVGGKISLGSDQKVEFGQAVILPLACNEPDTTMKVEYVANFVNKSSGGDHFFKGINFSVLEGDDCRGRDYVIRAYGPSSSVPLPIFNDTETSLVIYNSNNLTAPDYIGGLVPGVGMQGVTIKTTVDLRAGSNLGAYYSISLDSPAARTSDIKKITVETRDHVPCGEGTDWNVGSTGPGGGTIYYAADCGFPCGISLEDECHYLEIAPKGWRNGVVIDPTSMWAQNNPVDFTATNVAGNGEYSHAIGFGRRNTAAIIAQGNTNTSPAVTSGSPATTSSGSAAAIADAYAPVVNGSVVNDWFLPSQFELIVLCVKQKALYTSLGMSGYTYWSSSSVPGGNGRYSRMDNPTCTSAGNAKTISTYAIRPIRTF